MLATWFWNQGHVEAYDGRHGLRFESFLGEKVCIR